MFMSVLLNWTALCGAWQADASISFPLISDYSKILQLYSMLFPVHTFLRLSQATHAPRAVACVFQLIFLLSQTLNTLEPLQIFNPDLVVPDKDMTDPASYSDNPAYVDEDMTGEAHHQALIASAMDLVNITTSTYADKIHPNARDVHVTGLTLILAGRVLLNESDLSLSWGRRYGLVGFNGCGKSILLTLLGRRLLPLPLRMDSYHLAGEHPATEETALAAVMACDTERTQLEAAAATLEEDITGEDSPEQQALSDRLAEVYERLEEMGADQAEARASQILFGLGFSADMQKKKCREFSGGWRMRVALARALYLSPSLLLLDEPSNHLDMEAVVWLEKYLSTYKKILLMVSHSQDFMNTVCTNVIRWHPRTKQLEVFGGNCACGPSPITRTIRARARARTLTPHIPLCRRHVHPDPAREGGGADAAV